MSRGPAQQFPLPPIFKFRHGGVWRALLEPVAATKPLNNWDEIWKGPEQGCEILLLVTEPWRTWPESTLYYWRSRVLVGDLGVRAVEDIMRDFGTLIRQTPPVQRNWRKGLDGARHKKQYWHVLWIEEIDCVR